MPPVLAADQPVRPLRLALRACVCFRSGFGTNDFSGTLGSWIGSMVKLTWLYVPLRICMRYNNVVYVRAVYTNMHIYVSPHTARR
jgi:hypothetical protein